jgi:sigma-E factor negative regulatory protein RseA
MDTKEISREQISALADGELVDAHVSMALAVLRQPEEQVTWDLYHQIGDVMRSEEMAFSLSDGFAAKMSARLDAEPTIIAPQLTTTAAEQIIVPVAVNDATASNVVSLAPARKRFVRRFVMPGAAAAAAIVAVVLVTGQQQSTTVVSVASAPAPVVSTTVATAVVPSAITTVAATSSAPQGAASISSLAQQGEVARDPRIDDYLLAHQRFSPSMYSSAQYARSAAFAIDSDK